MRKIKLEWTKVPEAVGYIVAYSNPVDAEVSIDVGDVDFFVLENPKAETYEWYVTPYNDAGEALNVPRWTFTVEELLLPPQAATLVAPEDGSVVKLDEEVDLLPAILKSPPNAHEWSIGYPTILNLYWYIDEDSKPHDGCYVSVKKDGVLIVDRVDVPIGQTIENHFALDVELTSALYEWQVIPYDETDEAQNCTWWSFDVLAQSQTKEPYVQVGGVFTKDATFDLPVTVKLFRDINKFNLSLTYNTTGAAVGTCIGITQNPELGGDITMEHVYYQKGKRIEIAWVGDENKELEDDAVLFTLHFDNISGNNGGYSQVCWYNSIMSDPNEFQLEWFNNDVLLSSLDGGHYKNGWMNTTIKDGEVPLKLNPVNMSPSAGGGTVYKFLEPEKSIKINWMHGNPPRPDGWRINIKEDGVLIIDKAEVTPGDNSEFTFTATPDHTYEFQIIPFNQYGECQYNEWYTFKTETKVLVYAPISTIGTVESDEMTTVVPITVKNFNKIGCCDLEMTYDPAIVNCTHVTTDLPYMFFIGNPTEPGRIKISWLYFQAGDFDGVSLPDDSVVFNLHFSKINGVTGTSPIEFDTSNLMFNFWGSWDSEELLDTPEEDYYFNGSITQEVVEVTEVPECVGIITPSDNSVDVGAILNGNLMGNFKWNTSQTANGYKLYLSETLDFEDEIDVGNILTKRLELNFNTTYFWKIVPYNEIGDAIDCPVHTFTTLEDANFTHITTIQDPISQPDDLFSLNVTVKDFFSVGAISLVLEYDENVIDYQDTIFNSALSVSFNDTTPGQIRIGWFASNESQTLNLPPDTVLFTVHFKLKETNETETSFEWSKESGECEYAGYGGTPVYSDAVFNDLILELS